MLVETRDWRAALVAYEEAAEIVADEERARAAFLDGAALAAQELGRRNLPTRLERAWRKAHSMIRLRRWLGSSRSKPTLKRRTNRALEVCSRKSARLLALLHLVGGDVPSAAKLFAAAPGLGWSDAEHPGWLLFPLFHKLLNTDSTGRTSESLSLSGRGLDEDELEMMVADLDEPQLATPKVEEILRLAGTDQPAHGGARAAALSAMKKAAEKRLAGVVKHKRRGHYGHAAALAGACLAVDATPGTAAWLASIGEKYRRYPALQRELARNTHTPPAASD